MNMLILVNNDHRGMRAGYNDTNDHVVTATDAEIDSGAAKWVPSWHLTRKVFRSEAPPHSVSPPLQPQ